MGASRRVFLAQASALAATACVGPGVTTDPSASAALPHDDEDLPVVPDGALDADLRVSGPARARRTAQGWRVTRIGDGEVALRMVVVDSLLRVSATR